ncbi:hypothetical protein D0Z07_5920 [Hyphodiscus hymeniophilus]|uniref:F-box domain-containing protein n=1 Tax=Hyphodiscus hymeniophilus TaxID=353542 RepID=A0A9P7AWE7_9HELO|nr:hypothetical protein D0Z07_5920 [Hyphodiscus hymeniophilus]
MDTPGSAVSSDPSESSTDSSSTDSTSAQTVQLIQAIRNQSPLGAKDLSVDEDESDSDISMSAETDDEEQQVSRPSTIQVNPVGRTMEQPNPVATIDTTIEASNKRKYEDPAGDITNVHATNRAAEEVRKRLKSVNGVQNLETTESIPRQDKSVLPAEIWHHIFTFIPPRSLGLLLRVSRSFNAYLDPSSSKFHPASHSNSAAKPLKADAIWKASRVLFRPGMPAPLTGKSELDMWKLACSFYCQFCGKKQRPNHPPIDQWRPGPGENGNVPIWSFGIRTCGTCLCQRSSKEIDLLLSSSVPSVLMPALPFVFMTNELHIIPTATLQNGQSSSTVQITKLFFKEQIEDLKTEFSQVQSMGTATAEEWIKGLDGRGKEWRNDAGRWEKWEASGGIARMRGIEQYENVKSAVPTRTATPSATVALFPHNPHSTTGHKPMIQSSNTMQQDGQIRSQVHQLPQLIQTSFPTKPQARFDSPAQNGFGHFPRSYPPPRQERTKEEVAELKAARRAEIERRCMELDPPLTAGVLAHMGSFQAAIQIIQPLDDSAWEVLKPRLLSQRQDAEQRENDRLAQSRVVQEHLDDPSRFQIVKLEPDSKDFLERDWDDVQAPLRARLGGYSDEIIRDGWNDGEKVTLGNCSTFAAEVLIYVRKRFYAEVAKDEAAVRATGREPEADPPYGPYTRKLILENMKWVFDTKIKPHTEQYRKELFLCNDCGSQSKYYGFEGVIQHYAAKHTPFFSVGSIVVHWRAEWPENPPFDPEPANAASRNTKYATASSASAPFTASKPQQNYGYGGYQSAPVSVPMQVSLPHVYQESPGPYFGHPQFGEPYSGHQNGPYAPPQGYTDNSGGYPAQFSGPPQVGGVTGYNEPAVDYSQQGFGKPYPASNQGMYTSPHLGPSFPATSPEAAPQQQLYPLQGGQYGHPYNQPGPIPAPPTSQFTPPPLKTEEYKSQLHDVARNARAVWDSINNLKDVHGSVKVYTIIYHILQRSRVKFEEDPPLAMIVDGLNNNKEMRKVRNINGLRCKACSLGLSGSSSAFAKKLLSFPQLASHFLKDHEQASQKNNGRAPDWTKDMIKLPDLTQNNPIANSRGMDDKKLKLIAEALPEIFIPKPTQSDRVDAGPSRAFVEAADHNPYDLAPSLDNHDKYYTAVNSGKPSEAGSGIYDSGQYDPRHPRDLRAQDTHEDPEPRFRVARRPDDYREPIYVESERPHYEKRPASPPNLVRAADSYGRVMVREEVQLYLDPPRRDLDEPEVEYTIRRGQPLLGYDDHDLPDHGLTNTRSYQSNRHESHHPLVQEVPHRESRYLPAEDAAAQKTRIYDVVAQISQQAQHVGDKQPIKEEVGSEDGELRAPPSPNIKNGRTKEYTEASNAAENFLDTLQVGDKSETVGNIQRSGRHQDAHYRASWENQRTEDNSQHRYDLQPDPRRQRNAYVEDDRISRGRPTDLAGDELAQAGYNLHERIAQPRESRAFAYDDDRYVSSIPERAEARERSPELVDRRYKLNNVVYHDERQSSHGAHRTPSRYARYESVRLENDRARSRSPVYVKMGPQIAQYRERSPGAHPLLQEPIYRTRTPQPSAEEITYERAPPRPEYYRVYADEPRPRPQYVEAFEYVQVFDPNGDYVIRRPVRREREAEPLYARYEDERYARQPVYEARENRAPTSRPDAAYFEEYDPRNPGPPLSEAAPVRREIQYQ